MDKHLVLPEELPPLSSGPSGGFMKIEATAHPHKLGQILYPEAKEEPTAFIFYKFTFVKKQKQNLIPML